MNFLDRPTTCLRILMTCGAHRNEITRRSKDVVVNSIMLNDFDPGYWLRECGT